MSIVNLTDKEKSMIISALKTAYLYDDKSCFCIDCEASALEKDEIVHLDNCKYNALMRKLGKK